MAEAGVNFTVKIENAQAIGRALVSMQLRMRDMRPVLAEIGASLLTSTQRRFEDEAGPDGGAWDANQRGGAILRDTARLYQSLTYQVGADQVEVGTNVIYARIHQLGGQAGRGKSVTLPARPFLGLDDEDRREVLAIVNDHLGRIVP